MRFGREGEIRNLQLPFVPPKQGGIIGMKDDFRYISPLVRGDQEGVMIFVPPK